MQNANVRAAFIAVTATLAALASLTSTSAVAGPTAELKVTGVIKPVACTPTIGGGTAVVNYGDIPRGDLASGANKVLPVREVPFAISCDGAVKMAVKATDNRASSKLAGLASLVSASATENAMFGLGSVGTTPIGAFHFSMKQGSFTGTKSGGGSETVDTIGSADKSSWTKSTAGGMSTDRVLSWAPSGATTPGAYSTITGTLAVTAVLNKPENLPATQDISLDGSATIEVIYL